MIAHLMSLACVNGMPGAVHDFLLQKLLHLNANIKPSLLFSNFVGSLYFSRIYFSVYLEVTTAVVVSV